MSVRSEHDLVLRGARTIDPETGLDAVCDVAVDGSTISAVVVGGDAELRGRTEVNISGLVTYGYNWMLGQDTRFTAEQKAGTWRLTYYVLVDGKANIVGPADAGGRYGTPIVGPGNQTSLEIVVSSSKSKKPTNPGGGETP